MRTVSWWKTAGLLVLLAIGGAQSSAQQRATLKTPVNPAALTSIGVQEVYLNMTNQTAWLSYAYYDDAGAVVTSRQYRVETAAYPALLTAGGCQELGLRTWLLARLGIATSP